MISAELGLFEVYFWCMLKVQAGNPFERNDEFSDLQDEIVSE